MKVGAAHHAVFATTEAARRVLREARLQHFCPCRRTAGDIPIGLARSEGSRQLVALIVFNLICDQFVMWTALVAIGAGGTFLVQTAWPLETRTGRNSPRRMSRWKSRIVESVSPASVQG